MKAVAPKPVNLLVGAAGPSLEIAGDLGVRRISVGGALARMAWAGFMKASRDGGAGHVHRIREHLSRRRTQQDVQLGYESINSERPACICFGAYFRAAELGTVHAAILAGGAGVGIAI